MLLNDHARLVSQGTCPAVTYVFRVGCSQCKAILGAIALSQAFDRVVWVLILSQVMNCIACLEDLGSMGMGCYIYMMPPQHLVAKP